MEGTTQYWDDEELLEYQEERRELEGRMSDEVFMIDPFGSSALKETRKGFSLL